MARFESEFRDPPSQYRAAPFWSWNDQLTDEELIRQIEGMKAAGMGGFFMHSRAGLITPFLGPEWMERVRTCAEVAGRLGMRAWLYDEDRWPSGTAGALVTEPHPEYQMQPLVEVELEAGEPPPEEGIVAVFAFGRGPGMPPRIDPADTSRRRLLYHIPPPRPDTWFNGTAYLDTLNPDAVRSFIETAYAAYGPVVGEKFGGVVPGVFTDEPNYLFFRARPGERAVPWTRGLEELFRRRHGYDLIERLPCLFRRVGQWRKVRHDFRLTVTERFVNAYTRQIGRWCGRNRLMLTGHMLGEESLARQTALIGAAMPHYQFMQAPGVDILRERITETITLKQCTSVAHQFGRRWVLSELYGVTGWQFTFEGMKWMGDWHAVLGVNLRCPHLALYTLRGCRKRDYPPSFNYQSPWWDDYRLVEDYFARVNLALTRGRFVCDILLVHPMTSAWSLFAPGDAAAAERLSRRFQRLSEALLGRHHDHDYGDETILARKGRVSGGLLEVGRMAYRVVVVPPMPNIEPTTLALLEEFLARGGVVLAVEPVPTMLAGEPSEEARAFFQRRDLVRVSRVKDLLRHLDRLLPDRVVVLGRRGREVGCIWCHRRLVGSQHFIFLANIDRRRARRTLVRLPMVGRVEVLDAETGRIHPLPVRPRRVGGREVVEFEHEFAPAGSLLLRVKEGEEPIRPSHRTTRRTRPRRFVLTGPFSFKRSAPNALVLDFCHYRIRAGRWRGPVPVWKAAEDIARHFGLVFNRTNDSVQYWKLYPSAPRPGPNAQFTLRFEFEVKDPPEDAAGERGIRLVLEQAERYRIRLNGRQVDSRPVGWYVDRSFQVVELGPVRRGRNLLELTATASQDLEIENCYLIGSFAVDRRTGTIIGREPDVLRLGNWCEQGYPFYAGTMTYKQTVRLPELRGRRAVLEMGRFSAALVRVCVNGAFAGARGWAPFRFDITDLLQPGYNDIEIDLVATNRNLLGPHHFKPESEPAWVGPPQFSDEEHWTDEYLLHPYGLFSAPAVALE